MADICCKLPNGKPGLSCQKCSFLGNRVCGDIFNVRVERLPSEVRGPGSEASRQSARTKGWASLLGTLPLGFLSSTIRTCVGVWPMFSPVWVCSSDHMTSPSLNWRVSNFPSGRVSVRFEWTQRIENERGMFVLMCLLAREVVIIKNSDAIVLQDDVVFVTIGLDSVLRERTSLREKQRLLGLGCVAC